jgi:glycosyltransferase involved in cell wall biosynthesis
MAGGACVNILFVHQNFPGQFKHLAPALVQAGHEVTALTLRKDAQASWQGVRLVPYEVTRGNAAGVHPWVLDFESKVIRGEAAFRAALDLGEQGYTPDVILAHPGWGESLFLKQVWPSARLAIYCEFHHPLSGGDAGFDPEFALKDPAAACRLQIKNANNLMHFQDADAGISPTRWQADSFPQPFRDRITVIHDGIDTEVVRPRADAHIALSGRLRLTREDEVITFVNRNLEPYRGYHVFMRALPDLLKRRPRARVIIVGGDEVSYGAAAPQGTTWRKIFFDEVKDSLDLSRVHFVGKVPYAAFIALLQVSTVHVYLTYPFVLSWSLLEAMSAGCAIAASDTPPVREVLVHGETGRLFPFFDRERLVDEVCGLLNNADERKRLGSQARAVAQKNYDLKSVCLPRQMEWIASVK